MPVLFTFNTPNLKRLASSAPKYGLGPKMYKWVTWPWPRPFQGWLVVSRLGLASYRPNFKFLKCTNWGSLKQLGVTQGHRQCCHLLPFDRTHTTSYSTLIETMLLSCTVFATQPGICQKSTILTIPTWIWRPRRGWPRSISQRSSAPEN